MQIDQNLNPWVAELETAFQPYAEFVQEVALKLEAIELQAILTPPIELQVVVRTEVLPATTSAPALLVEQASAATAPKVKKILSEKRVLLVDDAEINRVLLSHYFKGLPVKLDFASSGEMAVQKCGTQNFDLIVIDDELQNPNGEAIAKLIREIGSKAILVALSNQATDTRLVPEAYSSMLKRGLAREAFIEHLKQHLWSA